MYILYRTHIYSTYIHIYIDTDTVCSCLHCFCTLVPLQVSSCRNLLTTCSTRRAGSDRASFCPPPTPEFIMFSNDLGGSCVETWSEDGMRCEDLRLGLTESLAKPLSNGSSCLIWGWRYGRNRHWGKSPVSVLIYIYICIYMFRFRKQISQESKGLTCCPTLACVCHLALAAGCNDLPRRCCQRPIHNSSVSSEACHSHLVYSDPTFNSICFFLRSLLPCITKIGSMKLVATMRRLLCIHVFFKSFFLWAFSWFWPGWWPWGGTCNGLGLLSGIQEDCRIELAKAGPVALV